MLNTGKEEGNNAKHISIHISIQEMLNIGKGKGNNTKHMRG